MSSDIEEVAIVAGFLTEFASSSQAVEIASEDHALECKSELVLVVKDDILIQSLAIAVNDEGNENQQEEQAEENGENDEEELSDSVHVPVVCRGKHAHKYIFNKVIPFKTGSERSEDNGKSEQEEDDNQNQAE